MVLIITLVAQKELRIMLQNVFHQDLETSQMLCLVRTATHELTSISQLIIYLIVMVNVKDTEFNLVILDGTITEFLTKHVSI